WLIYSFFSTFGRSEPSPDLATTDVRDAAMFRSSAATPAPDTPFAGSELELNKVKLPEAISLIYSEVLKVPYMLDPQLVNDERMI
ncbi:hypothetical protein LAW75_25675, partial [Escherichia coli]|nr:hypothetical protein [Escherichia coli]